jgi:hypothetical protein
VDVLIAVGLQRYAKARQKKLKATLRSDCLKLHAIYPAKSPERELPKGASEINDQADKMNRISREMKNLVEGSSSSKE